MDNRHDQMGNRCNYWAHFFLFLILYAIVAVFWQFTGLFDLLRVFCQSLSILEINVQNSVIRWLQVVVELVLCCYPNMIQYTKKWRITQLILALHLFAVFMVVLLQLLKALEVRKLVSIQYTKGLLASMLLSVVIVHPESLSPSFQPFSIPIKVME